MAIVEVSIVPIGTGATGISNYVAECYRVLEKERRIKHLLTPMGTILEGDLNVIMDVIQRMHEVPFEKGAMRVSTTIRIDDRRDMTPSMEQKIASVTEKIT